MSAKQVAVVTGGGAGIGACVARRLACEGYAVAVIDRDRDAAEAIAEELRARHGEAEPFVADLTDPQQIATAFDGIVAVFGRIDVLINNAGYGGYRDWRSISLDAWHDFTAINCDATFLCVQRAAREMVERHTEGRIVIVLSQAALNQDEDAVVPYSTSKWCERGLMRALARALAPYGITVNGVCPGTVWTPMMDGFCDDYLASGGESKEAYIAFIESKYPTGRLQTGDDIAAMCAFLARNGCHINGQSMLVAGGIVFS